MPPWLPEPGFGEFAGERRLTLDEIGLIEQWVREGGQEGRPEDLKPAPIWAEGWQLGRPDLVVQIPEPYTLAAEGRDVYRNFVVKVPLTEPRYIAGAELQPGNPKIVHHAFIQVDPTARSRRLDEADPEPGFAGMQTPAQMPGGQFLTWQPGKVASRAPKGLAWRLAPGDDLVLQMHLRPSGKPEKLQSSVGLYFTSEPPTNTCFKISLCSFAIDIPPGARNYEVSDSYVLPIDLDVLRVLPHAHYLCREMQGYATLPDGTRQWLLFIKQWDFNWQGDYQFATPVFLPKGTTLYMRYTYDNSTNNAQNPNQPPKRVSYGAQSSDEMGELWFQALAHQTNELPAFQADFNAKLQRNFFAADARQVEVNPTDAGAHVRLGMALLGLGRAREAREHFETAARLDPSLDKPHYFLGLMLRQEKQTQAARAEFETALRLSPSNFDAHGNLGLLCAEQGDIAGAEAHFREALRLNPDDQRARACLDELLQVEAARGKKQ